MALKQRISQGSQPTQYTAVQLTYNPAELKWDGQKEDWWACYTKKVQPDDEVFLLRVGKIPETMKGTYRPGDRHDGPLSS